MVFSEEVSIPLKDIDSNGKISDRGILEIFENAGSHHSDLVGFGVNNREKTGITWVLMDWKVKVLKRPTYGNKYKINTWARYINGEFKKTSTYRDFEILDKYGNLCVIGTSKWVIINIATRKIVLLDESIMNAYELEDKSVFEEQEVEKIKVPGAYSYEVAYSAKRSDVDFVSHVHNLYYIDIAYNALPDEVYALKPFNEYRITYKKEIVLGESLKCRYYLKDNTHTVVIFGENDEKIRSIITMKN